jgi:hypothetical protein
MSTRIKVGRTMVNFTLQAKENIYSLDPELGGAGFVAEFRMRGDWYKLGTYATYEEAAKALYVERPEFSAAEGA